MIESADTVYLVSDSSKIGKSSFASFGALSLIDFLITDSKIKESEMIQLKEQNIKVLTAGE